MWPLSESQGRFGQLVVLALWVMPTEGMSTQNTQLHSQHLGKDSNGLQRYTKLQGYGDTSLSTVGSFALYYTPAEEPITSGHKHELEKHDNEEFSGVQLASSRSVQPEAQNQIDDILHNAEIPLEVRNTALKSKEIRALGILLRTVRTFISKTTLKNRFLVISSYYKLYSLFRACAVAYGLGFLFSNVNQIAGLANIVVGTLTSLFLNRWMHNVYAGIISGANLPDKVENSLSTFIRNDRKRIDSFTHSSIIASIKEAMMTSVRSALNPQSLGDTIDRALVPLGPSGPQLMNFSTETISMDEFKTKYPFVFLLRHVETPVHAFTTELRTSGTTYHKLVLSLQSMALPILMNQITTLWDPLISYRVRPLASALSVKAQDLVISLMDSYAHKLPNLLEWSNRDVDYRALVATDWRPLIGALSNWEAKGKLSERTPGGPLPSDEMYSSYELSWRNASRMKQMYLLFLRQAAYVSFLQRGLENPIIRPGTGTCMSQFVGRLQSIGSPRLKAILDRVNLPKSFMTWELINQCFAQLANSVCVRLPVYFTSISGNKLVLSVSDEAVPLEIELRHPADKKTTATLQMFPKTLRPARSAFGYAGQQHFLSSEETGLFARLRKGAVRRAKQFLSPFLTLATLARQAWGRLLRWLKKSHGPKISMTVKPFGEDPNFLTIIFKAKGRMVHVVGRPLHMLQRIDPIQCEAARQTKSYLNYFQEQGSVTYREGTPLEGLPANRVQISYSSDEIVERFSQGLSFQLTTVGGMQGTINYLREWHLTKKLLHSAYPEARKLRIEQDTSEWHNLGRRHLQNMLRQSGVDGKPFKDSWTVILNCSESVENIRWEVLDLDVADQAQMVVKQYAPDFGGMATMASAVEAELNLAASTDHVLKRMQETFFDYAHKRTLYIESPGAFLQFLIESDSRKLAREFENWLLERLQGSTRNKRCRRGSFYGKAYAQYTALVDYYEKLDLTAQVPDLDEVKRFLLTASLPKGHLVRIPHEEDLTHGGIYRVVERLDRCTFLLENADRLQVATDASLHVVRRFEDGDRISHQHTQRRHFKYVGKDATTGVCTIKDKQSYQFKVRQEETTSIRVGKFSEQTSKLRNGNWMLSDARSAYNTLLELDNNFMAEFEVGQSIVQDCYTGRACIIRDDRDFPVMVEYAMPELATYALTGPWLWLFLNGLHAEYLSIISNTQFVNSREEQFWTQRTANELAQSCWRLPVETGLKLSRAFLAPSSPSQLSRAFSIFRRNRKKSMAVPNRCSESLKELKTFFPGAPKARGTTTMDPAHMVVLQQTEQIVSKTAHAAYLLRREREESAILGLKQHFKSKICGKHCAAWWLKANELKTMVKQFSETGQPAMTPQLEQSALAKALSTTTLVDYWTHRICMFEQTFRKLFARLRLPEEQDGSIPCSKVSAIIILAVAMSDVTLAVRRRAVATRKARLQRIADVLSFLEEKDVPVPCTYELPEAADLLQIDIPSESEECRQRDAATNMFMHMKSRIDAANVEVEDVIQQVRVRFTGTIYGRISRLFVSSNEADYRLQETDFRELDSDISDLFAVLHRPFGVWQGTLKQLQNEELLNMRMQQQCPFRPPQPTRHAKEAVPGAHIQLIQGFLPFGYDDPPNSTLQEQGLYRHEKTILLFTGLFLLQISARGSTFANSVIRFVLEEAAPDDFFKETAWPLARFLLRQSITLRGEPSAGYELQCDAVKNLRWGLKKLGLGSGESTIQQALEAFKKDVNFTEVASFLPPPVEGLDAKAAPVGFLRVQSIQNPCSILVMLSGNVLFGNIAEGSETTAILKNNNRAIVTLKHFEEMLYVEDSISSQLFKFEEPKECDPGSRSSLALLREMWTSLLPFLHSGEISSSKYGSWLNATTRHVDIVLSRTRTSTVCHSQRNFIIREVLKAVSHNTLVRIGDKAWHGTTLVTLEKIEGGVKFVRPTTTNEEDSTSVAITEPLFSAEKVRVGDLVHVSGSKVKYELLHITPLTSTTCVSKLRRKNSDETILSREPLFRLGGFQRGELVRKSSSIEVYEYMGTCGTSYQLRHFVTGIVEWTTEDLLPLWASQHEEVLGTTLDHIAGAYPKNELYVDLILFLKEFHKTEGARVSRTQFKKVLVILESHGRVSATEKESLQTTFDRRLNREAFYDAVDNVKKRTYDFLTDLQTKISSSSPPGAQEELLFAWGSATIAALEAMWRGRSLWRTLHRIFEMGLLKFFGEVNTLAQRPDILSALKVLNVDALREQGQKAITAYVVSSGKPLLLPSISDAVDKVSFESIIPPEAHSTTLQFFNFVGDGVMPTSDLTNLLSSSPREKALKMWEDYVTTVARRLEEFATQQDALDKYRKSLHSRDAAIPQSSLNASWTDKIVFRLSEVIGSLMKQELGNKLNPANIKSKLKPLLIQELVTVSELPLNSDGDKERVFGKISEFFAAQISSLHQIQNPGRAPRGEVLLDVLSFLEINGSDIKMLEDRLRHQYYQLSQKYVDQLVSSEVIDIDGVLDVIGQLEKALSNLLTPIIDQAIGLVKKAAQIISKPREKQEHYVIAFNALAASLEKIDTAVTPTEEKSEPVEVSGAINGTMAMSPMKDMGSLKRIYTRFLAKGAGAVSTAGAHLLSKITGTPIPDHLTNLLLIFWTPIRARALNAILKAAFSAFEGPNAEASALSVSSGLWNSAIQPVVDGMKVHTDIFTRLLGELDTGKGLTRDWWKEVPLLVFIRPMLYNVRSGLLDPSNLYKFWYQIKIATSASSGLYKVLTAPVKGLGAYVYLLLIKILNGILPAENGDFLLPREFRGKGEERPDLDIVLANPKDLIKFLHRLFDVLLKVYVPMVRELFDTGIQLLLQKVARHLASDDGTLDMRRLLNNIADHDVDGEFEEVLRDLLFKIADDMLRLWPAMPLGSPQPWQQM